jgi:putative transferase (TIGR04331 family)
LGPPDPKHPWSDHEHYYQYLLAQYELVAALPAEIRLGLVIRLHPAQDWWSESPAIEWKKRFPEVVIDSGSGTLATSARQCRLLISTYNSSSLYEAMALGDPVIAFWQRDRDLLREEAIPWFEMLSNVGILHYDALQAAQKITDIWGDVEGWWSTQPLVNVRSLFCQRFAHIPTKPLNHLKHSLRLSKSSSEAYS